MKTDKLDSLRIDSSRKVRPQGSLWGIFIAVILVTAVSLYLAWPKKGDDQRVSDKGPKPGETQASSRNASNKPAEVASKAPAAAPLDGVLLTVPGYIINRERIELSPRFMGVVKWIGVKKGDPVTNNQVVVLLDDAEYKARLHESEGRLAGAQAALEKAKLNHQRVVKLALDKVESQQTQDDMRLSVASAEALCREIQGQVDLVKTYIDWTVIRSPINGVVLEKLVDPNELVTPQSFGGTRGPSTALIALADPTDLQVEIDLNEADVAKVSLNQKCRVRPQAYPDKNYDGIVAEKAPEANRQKGTLQVKVQILKPDHFLTPELSADVDFLSGDTQAPK